MYILKKSSPMIFSLDDIGHLLPTLDDMMISSLFELYISLPSTSFPQAPGHSSMIIPQIINPPMASVRLVVSTGLKNLGQIGSFPQVGVKIESI